MRIDAAAARLRYDALADPNLDHFWAPMPERPVSGTVYDIGAPFDSSAGPPSTARCRARLPRLPNPGTICGISLRSVRAEWRAFASASGTDDLTADDIESASEVSAPAIGQIHALTADDTESASELSAPAIWQSHDLTAGGVESASEVTAPNYRSGARAHGR